MIDYTPLPLLWEYGGLSFVAFQTGKALQAEGAAMHHCVASYWEAVVDGSRIYSILENGSRVATLELTSWLTQDKLRAFARATRQRRRFGRNQLVGARNSRPAPKVVKVVGTFVEETNNRARRDHGRCRRLNCPTSRRVAAAALKHLHRQVLLQ